MSRHWTPCRSCGADHSNPMSSSVCPECGAEERRLREAEIRVEDDRWRYLPASYRAMDELEKDIGSESAEKVKALIEAMIQERHD